MRNKKIWMVIFLILAGGILITQYTASYVKEQEIQQAYTSQTTEWETLASQAPTVSETGAIAERRVTERQPESAAIAAETARAEMPQDRAVASPGEAQGSAVAEASDTVVSSGVASPLEGVSGRNVPAAQGSNYRQLLENLDSQIQRSRFQERDTTAYSLRTAAESELSLWEDEMNSIYNGLLAILPQEESEALVTKQQEWLRERESRAVEMNAKNTRVSLEGVSLTANMVTLTRERAYELVSQYERWTSENP